MMQELRKQLIRKEIGVVSVLSLVIFCTVMLTERTNGETKKNELTQGVKSGSRNEKLVGLDFDILRGKPLIFYSEEPFSFSCEIKNNSKNKIDGELIVEIDSKPRKTRVIKRCEFDVSPGAVSTLTVMIEERFQTGGADMRIAAKTDADEGELFKDRIYFTTKETLGTICGSAVRMTSILDLKDKAFDRKYQTDETYKKMTRRLLDDSVSAVIYCGHAQKDNKSYQKDLRNWLEHGLKIWRSSIISFKKKNIVCADSEKVGKICERAAKVGEMLRDNPAVLAQVMAGEATNYPPCYCEKCDQAFRRWLEKKYGTLEKLNLVWKTDYKTWDEIRQIGSPDDIDEEEEAGKLRRVDLKIRKQYKEHWAKLFELDRVRAMDWRRWHDSVLIDWYREFAAAYHQENKGTVPFGEQPCWPNYNSQNIFPLSEIADFGGLDSYLPGGMVTTLGSCADALFNFDFVRSLYHALNKPVMVNELYTLDNYPPNHPEAMGWWLMGRGYRLPTFFTYREYREGVRNKVRVIFGLYTRDWKPYPTHASFRRFCEDQKRFHQIYDYNSTRRLPASVALFLGDDMTRAAYMETGGAPWQSSSCHGNWGSYWLAQRNGHEIDFINDDHFERLADKKVLIVPWCPVIKGDSLKNMLRFAENGGTVIIDGPIGLYNDLYQSYNVLPGGKEFSEAIGVSFKTYKKEKNKIIYSQFGETTQKALQTKSTPKGSPQYLDTYGIPVDVSVTKGNVLLKDVLGNPALVEARIGEGRVCVFLTCMGARYNRVPGKKRLEIWETLFRQADTYPYVRFVPEVDEEAGVGLDITGRPIPGIDVAGNRLKDTRSLFDATMRVKGEKEAFVFISSFFGHSKGWLELRLPEGDYVVNDVLLGANINENESKSSSEEKEYRHPLEMSRCGSVYRLPIDMKEDGGRVIHIKALEGTPFKGLGENK